jgi:mannose-6-phosphate isomerase-like protein (cupin superfamily)
MAEPKVVAEGDSIKITIDKFLTISDYFTKSSYANVSLVTAQLNGPHDSRINKRSTKLYFVTEGTLDVVVDKISYKLFSQDALIIPPGKWHSMEGHDALMLIICVPAFDGADEEEK